ncbi:hypothetical protein K435DRAFT_876840 [Dendrothele bispora CBS 962.96]|uniref:Uncharacterized protein n=1 Tax=Dendrothele bispora (strain CBS 962.96) TaxID=1314807 RepID=A0A4S8KS91_DENBC|nr:hypothetical protein K435DRAFT_876840 [Dendrothele bispora CBS 962.96]
MSKGLVLPALTEPLTADSIQTWITNCDDRIELFSTWNPTVTLSDRTKIMCAAVAFDLSSVKLGSFWGSKRDSCLSGTWDAFKLWIKSQFLGSDSKVDALQSLYLQAQGLCSFSDFLSNMQSARATLNAYGKTSPFYVSDFLMKSTVLFRCHPTLRLRVRAIPSFSLESTSLDRPRTLAGSSSSSSTVLPSPPVTLTTGASLSRPITAAKHEAIKAKGGRYNCGRSPKDPDWKAHGGTPYSRHCPGNTARGIASRGVVATLLPADQTNNVLSFFGFVDTPDAPIDPHSSGLASGAALTGGLPVVHTASGAEIFAGSTSLSGVPIAAVISSYGYDEFGDEIDDESMTRMIFFWF